MFQEGASHPNTQWENLTFLHLLIRNFQKQEWKVRSMSVLAILEAITLLYMARRKLAPTYICLIKLQQTMNKYSNKAFKMKLTNLMF